MPGVTTAPNANSTGNSEPEIAFRNDGTVAVDGLAWLPFQLDVWTGQFGTTPSYFGAVDANLQNVGTGRTRLGSEDTDVKYTSAGTMLVADLDLIINRNSRGPQLGVNVTRCPAGATGPGGCTPIFLDTAGADRPWLTTAGTDAWVAYHDAGNSRLIRVMRSTDDGQTWQAAASPILGQGTDTGAATADNELGPIVADPGTGTVYEVYATGDAQTKAKGGSFDNIFVSRSTDGAKHWTTTLVFHAPSGTGLDNIFPALAVDPVTHVVYAAWTDQHTVSVSQSDDAGVTWSAPATVSTIQTTVMPWVAARNGKVDVVYYGSTAASPGEAAVRGLERLRLPVLQRCMDRQAGQQHTQPGWRDLPERLGVPQQHQPGTTRPVPGRGGPADRQGSDHLHRLHDRHLDERRCHERTAGDRAGI